jgi:hypothetical protein
VGDSPAVPSAIITYEGATFFSSNSYLEGVKERIVRGFFSLSSKK